MQTPKSKCNHIDGAQRTAVKSSSDSVSSAPHQTTRTSKDRSAKIIERRSPQGRLNEKRSTKFSDLEASYAPLREELRQAKDQASSSEFQRKQAQQEVEDGRRQISSISSELNEIKNQLIEISSSEDDRLQELCKVSQERDKAWESELEAVRKQQSMDTDALASSMYEIQKLKNQVKMVTELEAVQTKRAEFAEGEARKLQFELGETLMLVERLKSEARQSRGTEVPAQETSDQVTQPFISMSSKSDQSENFEAVTEYINQLEQEIHLLKLEVTKMRAALNAAEVRYQEEYIQSTLQIRSAYELVEVAKSESRVKVAELEAELKRIKSDMEDLQAKQKKENEKPRLTDKENVWAMELKKTRAALTENTIQLQAMAEEKEKMKIEIQNLKAEKTRAMEDAAGAEKLSNSKIIHLTQEADQNSKKLAQVKELLDAAEAANAETEAELKRLTIQCDQWRKAAEAAAVMLTTGSDKYIDTIGRHLNTSQLDDEMDYDPSGKRNGSMLQKIGVLWKKSNSNKQM